MAEWIRSVLRTTTTSLVPGNVALMELAHGNWVTATLYVAAKLNIADELAGGPLGAEEIARRVGADPDAIRRIMRALASKAVFKQTNDGRFALTPVGQALRSDTHGSMRDFILFIGCPSIGSCGAACSIRFAPAGRRPTNSAACPFSRTWTPTRATPRFSTTR